MKMIFLVDGDNNIGTGLKGITMLSEQDTVLIFYQKGLALTKIKKICAASRADVQYVESVKGGKNSIDFQIITELGVLVGKREADFAYVISQDKGYAASIEALRLRYADAFQEVALRPSIEECLHLAFVLKAADRRELRDALVGEYGAAQGRLLYNRLLEIFTAPEEAEKPGETAAVVKEKPAAAPEQTKTGTPAEKTAAPAAKAPGRRPLLSRRKAPAKAKAAAAVQGTKPTTVTVEKAAQGAAPQGNQPGKPAAVPQTNPQATQGAKTAAAASATAPATVPAQSGKATQG
ncbi:MAG: PIN domain-containing protein, partial [Oscillibacter sp.]